MRESTGVVILIERLACLQTLYIARGRKREGGEGGREGGREREGEGGRKGEGQI